MSPITNENPIKLGVIGLSTRGWAADAHAPALSHPSVQSTYTLTALQTGSPASATRAREAYAKTWPQTKEVKTYYGSDATAISNDPDVDVVVVSVKAPDHKAAMDKAIAAGKHIFVEYPPGRTLEESEDMRKAALRNGNIEVMVGLQGIHSSKLRKVKKIIDEGKIGKILSTTIIANIPREIRAWQPEGSEGNTYILDKNNGASLLSIAGGHQLGNFIHLLGPFANVSATASRHYPSADIYSGSGEKVKTIKSNSWDHYTFSGSLKSGAHASITWKSGYKSTPGRMQFLWIIDGEEGSIKFQSDSAIPPGSMSSMYEPEAFVNGKPLDEYLKEEGIEYSDPGLVVEDGEKGMFVEFVRREWLGFAKTLRGGKGEYATLDDAIEVQRVVDAVERSAQSGGLSIKLN